MALIYGLYFCKVDKVLAVVLYSSQLSNFQLLFFISYFVYLLIDILRFTPRGCATALIGQYVPKFPIRLGFWVFVSGGARD